MTEEIKIPESKNQKCQRVLNNWLYAEYHDIFNPRKPRPLMVGIAKVLEEHLPEGITLEDLKIALRSHYKMQNYMRAVLVESHRVNLQGEPVSEIPFEEKKIVKESLEKFYKQQLENYLKRFTPTTETETADVESAEPKVTPVEPELKVTPEPVAEKVIVAEPGVGLNKRHQSSTRF
jgi:sRNA-binding protein